MGALNQSGESSLAVDEKLPAGSSTLRGDFIWTLFGNGIYAAAQWLILVLLAKNGSPELVGHYSFAVAVATPVMAFASLQLRSVQVTDVADYYSFGEYLGFRIWTVVTAMLLLTVICLVMRYSARATVLIELIGIALAIETGSDLYYGVMQIHCRMDRIAKSMIARGVLTVIAISIVLKLTGSLVLVLVALVAVRVAIALLYDMHIGTKGLPTGHTARGGMAASRPIWSIRRQANILKLAFPIGIVALLVSLNTSIPRYFIQWALGPRELGIFSALCFFSSSGNMISSALGQAAFARLATAYGRGQVRTFLQILSKLMLVALALGVAGIAGTWVWGAEFLRVLYKPEYAQRSGLLVLLMLAAGIGYFAQFIGAAVTSARAFNPQIPLFVVVGSTLTVSSYLLVPKGGLHGAILAIMVTNLVQFLGSLFILIPVLRSVNSVQPIGMLAREPEGAGVATS